MSDPLDTIAGLDEAKEEIEGLDDRKQMRANLFGDSDSEDEAEDPSGKKALAALAARKRLEQQEAEQAERSRKRPREAELPEEEPARADAGGDASEDEGLEAPATAEDAAFIDDEGAPPDERPQEESESDEEPDRGGAPAPDDEAEEEEDEFEAMFASKGRKRGGRTSVLKSKGDVDSFMGMMEAAAMTDLDANREGKPAVHKLKMLAEAEDMLARRDLHNTFLDGGLLGVLKAWLEPMPDGSLPNERVRSAVLRVLQQLPIDVTDEGRKDQLKRSRIGQVVLFLFKLPDESAANRRVAKELVEKWSRPIFDQYRERRDVGDAQERELQLLQARRRHEPGAEGSGTGEQEGERKALKPGDPGFRWHASIPEPARLDYVRRPTSQVAADVVGKSRRSGGKMDKRLKLMNRPGRTTMAKAAKVSVEGRGM